MIGGVDEAGRGPLVGPMVVALVAVEREDELRELGVRDSKQLSPEKREELYERIVEVADTVLVKRVEPFVIDRFVDAGGLNRLEALVTAELIAGSGVDVVYVDAPDVDPLRYRDLLLSLVGKEVEIVAEHGADAKYPVVSAASIVAKVERDRIIRRIEEVYGRVGSGYPHDEDTLKFVEYWMKRLGHTPTFVRSSWRTARGLSKRLFQRKIDEFL